MCSDSKIVASVDSSDLIEEFLWTSFQNLMKESEL